MTNENAQQKSAQQQAAEQQKPGQQQAGQAAPKPKAVEDVVLERKERE